MDPERKKELQQIVIDALREIKEELEKSILMVEVYQLSRPRQKSLF